MVGDIVFEFLRVVRLVRPVKVESTHLFNDTTIIHWTRGPAGFVDLARVEQHSEQHDQMFTLCLLTLKREKTAYYLELFDYAYQAAYPNADESHFIYPLSKVIS